MLCLLVWYSKHLVAQSGVTYGVLHGDLAGHC